MTDNDIAWRYTPCPTCGTEHREDCPNKYETLVSVPCDCEEGCDDCSYTGSRITRIPGHIRLASLERRNQLAAAERAVVEAGVRWFEMPRRKQSLEDDLTDAIALLIRLRAAKGGR